MKKVQLFAAVAAISIIFGSAAAFTVNKISGNEKPEYIYSGFSPGAGTQYTNYAPDGYPDLTYAAENAVKGVVNIEIVMEVRSRGRGYSNPWEDFFGFGFGGQEAPQPREQRGGGSGVIVSSDGYIVTNNHVVENAKSVKVTLDDGRMFDAHVIGTDPTTDVALIKVDATGLPAIPFGNSDDLRLGEWVLAIGSPLGLQNTITAGIVSAKARNLSITPEGEYGIESYIQTDAAVNRGNSGGALVNTGGQLVGINTLIQSQNGGFIGYSFAVPSALVQKVVTDLKEYGVVQRAVLGVQMQEIRDGVIFERGDNGEAREIDLKEKSGLYIAGVTAGSAAEAAGIRKGDVIVGLDGQDIASSSRLQEIIGRHRPNDKVELSVKRDGQLKQIDVVLRNLSGDTGVVTSTVAATVVNNVLGGTFSNVTDKEKTDLKIDGGVKVVSINAGGILSQARVRQDYIITHINDRRINSTADLSRINDRTNITSIDGVYPDGRAASYSLVR